MATLRMREALRDAMAEEMRRDEAVFVMGEDVGVFQGAFKVTEGLLDEFGERRVRDTPISENTIVGTGVGAAMNGLRPIVELMTVNFSLLALDQIVNHAAAIPYMFNGHARGPMVIRMPGGGGHQLGPPHSHSFEALYLQVPGLLVACPSTPADGKALLKAAIRDDNPVVFIEHESLYGRRGEGGADGAGACQRARGRGRGDRPAHAAPARPRHDPRVGAQDQPGGDRRGGLAARRRRRQPGDADHRAGLRPPRRAGAAGDRRRRPHALFQAAGASGDTARGARGAGGPGDAGGGDLVADIVMPRLSDSMEEGTILQWLKSVGDEIAVGDELVEIETDKANMAYESDIAGTLTEILAEEGETLAIGTPIARVGDDDGSTRDSSGAEPATTGPVAEERDISAATAGPVAAEGGALRAGHGPSSTPPSPTPPAEGEQQSEAPAGDGHRPKASPLARRLAKEQGLDLSKLEGAGPGGRIVKADVERPSSAGDAVGGVPHSGGDREAGSEHMGEAAAAGPAAAAPGLSAPETAKGQVEYEDLSKVQQG